MLIRVGGRQMGFALFCHRRPERSFKIRGYTFPLCSRCTGLVAGFFGALALFSLSIPLPFWLGLALTVPMAVDGATQFFGSRQSNNTLRLLTGFMFTLGFLAMVVKA